MSWGDLYAAITEDDCYVWALMVGAIYFGYFIALGWAARVLVRYLMNQYGAELADVQCQAGDGRRAREVFLLGAWRKEK